MTGTFFKTLKAELIWRRNSRKLVMACKGGISWRCSRRRQFSHRKGYAT